MALSQPGRGLEARHRVAKGPLGRARPLAPLCPPSHAPHRRAPLLRASPRPAAGCSARQHAPPGRQKQPKWRWRAGRRRSCQARAMPDGHLAPVLLKQGTLEAFQARRRAHCFSGAHADGRGVLASSCLPGARRRRRRRSRLPVFPTPSRRRRRRRAQEMDEGHDEASVLKATQPPK
jgi:hypothetical protein